MLPQVTVAGRPNPQAMVLAARALQFCEARDERGSTALAESVGATQVAWRNRASSPLVDFSVFRDAETLWVNVYGTEDVSQIISALTGRSGGVLPSLLAVGQNAGGAGQILSYLTTIFPTYDGDIGAYVLGWALLQARSVLPEVIRQLQRDTPQRIAVCGHSLGGATAHVLSRLIKYSLTPGQRPALLLRPAFAIMRMVQSATGGVGEGTPVAVPQAANAIDLLTFGEPRSVGDDAEYAPRSHWRIVGALAATGSALPVDQWSIVDIVTLLPPNAVIAPGPGLFTGLPGIATVAAKVGIGVTPIHYGVPVYLSPAGQTLREPFNFAQRFALETAASIVTLASENSTRLHFLWATYLPGSVALANSGLQPRQGENTVDPRLQALYAERARLAGNATDAISLEDLRYWQGRLAANQQEINNIELANRGLMDNPSPLVGTLPPVRPPEQPAPPSTVEPPSPQVAVGNVLNLLALTPQPGELQALGYRETREQRVTRLIAEVRQVFGDQAAAYLRARASFAANVTGESITVEREAGNSLGSFFPVESGAGNSLGSFFQLAPLAPSASQPPLPPPPPLIFR